MSIDKKVFMGETYDINDYYKTFPSGEREIRDTQYLKGTFVDFRWLFIGDWEIKDLRISNLGVKADQNKGEASDEMAYEYEVNGWDMGSFPPTQGTDGDFRDGRTRVIGAIKKNQQWICVAMYNFEETNTPIKDKVTEGLRVNVQKPSTRSTSEDFVVAGIASIDARELKRDEDSIMDWLINNAKIGARFSNNNGHYKRIVNWILDRTANKDNLTLVLDREDWMTWAENIPLNINKIHLYKANPTNTTRLWCDHILPDNNPHQIVIYADSYSPEKCSAAVETMVDTLDTLYKQTYNLVNKDLAGGPLNLTTPTTKPYTIIGVCPNLKRGDQPMLYKNNELISVEDYINDGSSISNALNLAA